MNAHQQYAREMQARYLKYIQKEDQRDKELAAMYQTHTGMADKEKKLKDKVKKKVEQRTYNDVNEYRIMNIVIDSDYRDVNLYPNANDFVVKLQETIKSVVALRILKTEFYQPSNSFGYFVLNEMRVPLQLYNVSHAYLYVNGYHSTAIANESNTTYLGRIGPGTEMYPSITADPMKDPYVHVFRPIEAKMRRFHVKLYNPDGSLYPVSNARVVLTIALYCTVVAQ